jgi:hypothetical protein
VEEVEAKILQKLEDNNPEQFGSTYTKGHFTLRIHPQKRHFWSPQMDISVREDDDEDFTVIRCLLAPAPVVWTMFMFLYALAGFGALVSFMIASSQYSLDKDMWGIWMGVGALVFGIVLYLVAQSGKRLSSDEMHALKNFIQELNFQSVNKSYGMTAS